MPFADSNNRGKGSRPQKRRKLEGDSASEGDSGCKEEEGDLSSGSRAPCEHFAKDTVETTASHSRLPPALPVKARDPLLPTAGCAREHSSSAPAVAVKLQVLELDSQGEKVQSTTAKVASSSSHAPFEDGERPVRLAIRLLEPPEATAGQVPQAAAPEWSQGHRSTFPNAPSPGLRLRLMIPLASADPVAPTSLGESSPSCEECKFSGSIERAAGDQEAAAANAKVPGRVSETSLAAKRSVVQQASAPDGARLPSRKRPAHESLPLQGVPVQCSPISSAAATTTAAAMVSSPVFVELHTWTDSIMGIPDTNKCRTVLRQFLKETASEDHPAVACLLLSHGSALDKLELVMAALMEHIMAVDVLAEVRARAANCKPHRPCLIAKQLHAGTQLAVNQGVHMLEQLMSKYSTYRSKRYSQLEMQ